MENELLGGLKNAIERGQSLEQAKQSFLNAGYKQEEVESAATMIYQNYPLQYSKQPYQPVMSDQFPQFKQLPQSNILVKAGFSKIWIIILILLSSMILVGAAILGLYWDQLFR